MDWILRKFTNVMTCPLILILDEMRVDHNLKKSFDPLVSFIVWRLETDGPYLSVHERATHTKSDEHHNILLLYITRKLTTMITLPPGQRRLIRR